MINYFKKFFGGHINTNPFAEKVNIYRTGIKDRRTIYKCHANVNDIISQVNKLNLKDNEKEMTLAVLNTIKNTDTKNKHIFFLSDDVKNFIWDSY